MTIYWNDAFKAERMNSNGKYQVTKEEYDRNLYHGDDCDWLFLPGPCLVCADNFVIVDNILPYKNPWRTKRDINIQRCKVLKNICNEFRELFLNVPICEEETKRDDRWEYTQVIRKIKADEKIQKRFQFAMMNYHIDNGDHFRYNGPNGLQTFGMREPSTNIIYLIDGELIWLEVKDGRYVD